MSRVKGQSRTGQILYDFKLLVKILLKVFEVSDLNTDMRINFKVRGQGHSYLVKSRHFVQIL